MNTARTVRYRAYRHADNSTALYSVESEAQMRKQGLIESGAILLWEINAASGEEAMAIYNLRLGFEPYKPLGRAQPCPTCGGMFYPEGSAECWRCGTVK